MTKRMMYTLQLNAVQDGDRVLILPMGEIKGRDGRYWELTQEDANRIVQRIEKDGVDIVLDYDHDSYFFGGPAAGWLTDWQVEDRGITAKIELTKTARERVDAREYRYLSPAFYADGTRILELESVALTNIPNITELPALNNKSQKTEGANMGLEQDLQRVRGERDTATAELNKITQERDGLQAEKNSLLQKVSDLEGQIAQRDQQAAEAEINAMVEDAITKGKLAPAQRETAKQIGLNSKQDLESLVANSPLNLKALEEETQRQNNAAHGLDESELEMCRVFGLDLAEYAKNKAAE